MQEDKEKRKTDFSRENTWYNRDWEVRVTHGRKGRKEYVYTGVYYDLQPKELRLRMRVVVAVSTIILVVIYALLALSGTQGAMAGYVGYPCAFGLLPLLYFCMGAFWYVYTGEKMTYRRYHASEKRLRTAGWLGLACTAVTAVGEMVFLVLHFREVNIVSETLYLIGAIICSGQYALVLRETGRNPIQPVEEKSTGSKS